MSTPTSLALTTLLLASPAWAGNDPTSVQLQREGHFCEVIWSASGPARVSCFHVSNTATGPALDGTAFTMVRTNEDGTKRGAPPKIAVWHLEQVESYDRASSTLVYTYTGTMLATDTSVKGTSSVSFGSQPTQAPEGWFRAGDASPFRFRLLTLPALEACLGVTGDQSQTESLSRYTRVATSTAEELEACVPALPSIDAP